MNPEGKYLEFSGVVLDRVNKVAYVSISIRCHLEVAQIWAKAMNYELVTFRASVGEIEVLHANKVLQIGTGYAVFCGDAVGDDHSRSTILQKLKESGRVVVEITLEQMLSLCGQCHEVRNGDNRLFLAMSSRGYNAFSQSQLATLGKFTQIIHSSMDTLEKIGGGSVSSIINDFF